jgi:hypothetical protein
MDTSRGSCHFVSHAPRPKRGQRLNIRTGQQVLMRVKHVDTAYFGTQNVLTGMCGENAMEARRCSAVPSRALHEHHTLHTSLSNRRTCFPKSNGIYLYLIMCLICRLMVITTRMPQYTNRMGQNTGTSKKGNNVATSANIKARVENILHTRISDCFTLALATAGPASNTVDQRK